VTTKAGAKSDDDSPAGKLEQLVQKAVLVARKARRNRRNLSGDNYYGNKLAELRADAANVFRGLSSQSAGDTTALAELIEVVFAANTSSKNRLQASRDLVYSLRTTWKQSHIIATNADENLFPLSLLFKAKRGYLVTIGRQMNGCYSKGWYDACAVMMRRIIEIVIIEAFEHKNIANKIKNADGDYVHLTELVALALSESTLTLSRNTKKYLPKLRDIGHLSAHGRYYHAQRNDIDKNQQGLRVVVEEFLHHAGLL
jgi:hypothetical protein